MNIVSPEIGAVMLDGPAEPFGRYGLSRKPRSSPPHHRAGETEASKQSARQGGGIAW